MIFNINFSMDKLRSIVNWLVKYPFRSLLLIAGTIGIVFYIKNIIDKNEGILSEPLKKGYLIQSVYGIGTIEAQHRFQLKPAVVSSIRELYVKEGDAVKKGAKLALLDNTLYQAPFNGTVTSLPFKIYENVFAQTPILTLVDLNDRYLLVSLEQQGALRVEKGQKVLISFDSFREERFEGTVESVYSNESNFFARINIKKIDSKILPGMTADVAIQIDSRENSLLVPVAAYHNGGVWRKRGRSVQFIPIKLGIVDKEMGELTSGDLIEGDRLLIKQRAAK